MLKTTLRSHQVEAVEKALPYPGFCLFMEQRTGKTLTALAIVEKRKPRLLMIVTVKNGKKVWKDQIAEHLEIDWPMQVVITHFQELHLTRANWRKFFREYSKGDIMVICDESHLIKRRGSQAARIVRSLGKLAAWRLALTGTPLSPRSNVKRRKRSTSLIVTDGLEDIWSQFDFIDPAILGSAEDFERRYLVKGGFRGFKVIGYRNKPELRKLIEKYSYRKLLAEVQEKKTQIRRIKVKVKLRPATRQIYGELDKKMNAFGLRFRYWQRKRRSFSRSLAAS
jgi:SNF2 family DNA or RNA helicase